MKHILLILLFSSSFAFGQKLKKADWVIINNLKSTITYLASDSLEGRRTGTPGEKLAYEFLSGEFEKAGLEPKGDAGTYLQAFEVNEGKQVLPQTHLSVNGVSLEVEKDFFPFIFSSNGSVSALASPSIKENNAPWFFDSRELIEENASNPHFDLEDAIRNKAIESAAKGAAALIVYNTGMQDDELKFEPTSKITPLDIPVIFLSKNVAAKYLNEKTSDVDLNIEVAIGDKKRTGHNVIGYVDNGAANTIVIGAHYDHLGYGEDHNSLWTGEAEIHNGADDNASGTATVIELAKLIKNSKFKNNNYLFICFSGEELGLFGSKYFTEHPSIPIENINYMINCDMVGRLNDSSHTITIGGFGTSPAWGKILPQKTKALSVKFDSSGIGPSDHTSFYLKNIPVLFFFTGIHKDYHKPTDDADKINFTGELRIIQYIFNVIKETNGIDKLAFLKTREPQMGGPRFTVSLGIMPDYTFSGAGLRADGIIDGKIASNVGMHAGDIIIQLGDFKVTDINTYMTALSKYKKGEATKVTVQRAKEELVFDIIF
ncbi:MAG: M20/M25/M40 family metallo-hydrolase [Ginsengibacter sp.]